MKDKLISQIVSVVEDYSGICQNEWRARSKYPEVVNARCVIVGLMIRCNFSNHEIIPVITDHGDHTMVSNYKVRIGKNYDNLQGKIEDCWEIVSLVGVHQQNSMLFHETARGVLYSLSSNGVSNPELMASTAIKLTEEFYKQLKNRNNGLHEGKRTS